MIYFIHKNNKIRDVLGGRFEKLEFNSSKSITEILHEFAESNPNELLIWCYQDYVDCINKDAMSTIFYHKHILASYGTNEKSYIPEQIGFVDQSSFAEAFPMTWLETLAMEKALVAANIGWAEELIDDGTTGYLENPLNHKKFSNKIVELLNDKEKNKRFGKMAEPVWLLDFQLI